jgi:nucleoside-diphosphate-sugar epimerase
VASPFKEGGSDDEFIKPAVEGTKAILEGCVEYGVKKCIITSSMVAVYGSDNIKDLYTEEDFNPKDGQYLTPYAKSKIMADLFAIEFRKNLPSDCPLEIVSIHPGFITGKF